MGVTECDNMLMILGVSSKLTDKERDVVVPLLMRGFKVSSFCIFSHFKPCKVLNCRIALRKRAHRSLVDRRL